MSPRNKFLIIGNLVIFGFVGALGLYIGGNKARNRRGTSAEAPFEVAYADACKGENDGKVIAVKGYLSLGAKTRCRMSFGQQGCYLSLGDRSYTGQSIEAFVRVEDEPGTMDRLPASYTTYSDLHIHTRSKDGFGRDRDAGYNDYVRVIGEVSAPRGGVLGTPVCSISVSAVELAQLPTPALTATPELVKPSPTPRSKRKP